MAQQGSGLGSGPDSGEFKDPTSFNARSGAAKKPQTSFDTKWGMKNQNSFQDAGPDNPGTGPAAVLPDPLDGGLRKEDPGELKASWDMKGAHGAGLDTSNGGKVLGQAILSGASTLPSGESYSKSQPVRKPG